ncbi:MAG: lytic transglycosylase domain-containing protein [Bdellovibrionota bacterium]
MRFTKLSFFILVTLIMTDNLSAYESLDQYKHLLPQPGIVSEQVRFWENIFTKFPSTTTLVHDSDNPKNIVDIIDHKVLVKGNKSINLSYKHRLRLNDRYLKRYNLALKRFQRLGKKALQFGGIERRIYSVFSRKKSDLAKLYKGEISLRTQTGLSDELKVAAERAQDYLPYIERTFRSHKVPTIISRLAFVESMFNINARSKVGASGIWQFMPKTAQMYMNVNHLVDERNSPFKSSKGAAKLLADNYKSLQSWPLAITAYNHGRGGISRAVRQTGSSSIDQIINNYRSSTFGFASKNFYAEFLAVAKVYNNLITKKIVDRRISSLRLTPIILHGRYSLYHLLKFTPLTKEIVQKYNPEFQDFAYRKGIRRLLPKNYELFVPTKMAQKVLLGLGKINIDGNKYAYENTRTRSILRD